MEGSPASRICLSISSSSLSFLRERSANHAAAEATAARNAISAPAHVWSMHYLRFPNMVRAAFAAPSFFAVCEKMTR